MLGKFEQDVLRSDNGDAIVVSNATVEVRAESDSHLLTSSELFSDQAGTTPLGNPFTVSGSTILFYAPVSDRYRIAITQGSFSRTLRYVTVNPPPISDFIADDLLPAEDAEAARTALGATAVGHSLFTAFYDGDARADIGAGDVGDSIFTSYTISEVLSILGMEELDFAANISLAAGGTPVVPVYSTNIAKTFKVGTWRHCWIIKTGDGGSEGSGTGIMSISLPENASHSYSNGNVGHFVNGASNTSLRLLRGSFTAGSNLMSLTFWNDTAGITNMTGANQNQTVRTLDFQFWYRVG